MVVTITSGDTARVDEPLANTFNLAMFPGQITVRPVGCALMLGGPSGIIGTGGNFST